MEQNPILPPLDMSGEATPLTEEDFATLVTLLQADALLDLMREDHPVYTQRGTAATARMRGWVLLALASGGLPEQALVFVLEELETSNEPYLVAAAATALRNYPKPHAGMVPFLLRSIDNIRYHDDLVCLSQYGGFVVPPNTGATALHELLSTLLWLGPLAQAARPALDAMLSAPGVVLSVATVADIQKVLAAFPLRKPRQQTPRAAMLRDGIRHGAFGGNGCPAQRRTPTCSTRCGLKTRMASRWVLPNVSMVSPASWFSSTHAV